jgi:predicted N-acetyltransferase YhbS
MMDNVIIKTANASDAPLLSGLIRESFRDVAERFNLTPENCPKHPSNCTEEWIQKDLARGVTYYVLIYQGIPVGCVAMERANPELCYLERLAVLPTHRRKGLGKALVDHVFSEVKASGAGEISIGIVAQQTGLKRWYQKLGFIEGETKEFAHLPFQVTLMMNKL